MFRLSDKAKNNLDQLSGGQRRRILFARALMHRPRLLILDEPTAGVDVDLRIELWEYIHALHADGTTVLLTTHYLEEAEALCEEIVICAAVASWRAAPPTGCARTSAPPTSPASTRRRWRSPTWNTGRWREHDRPRNRARRHPRARHRTLRPEPFPVQLAVATRGRPLPRIWHYSILGMITTPLLMLLIFGFALNHQVKGTGAVSYTQFILPGLIGQTMMTVGYTNGTTSCSMRGVTATSTTCCRVHCAGGRSIWPACSRR